MSMNEEDEKKMEEIRKFSAIYGRFDCKRKAEKPLTLHEVTIDTFFSVTKFYTLLSKVKFFLH